MYDLPEIERKSDNEFLYIILGAGFFIFFAILLIYLFSDTSVTASVSQQKHGQQPPQQYMITDANGKQVIVNKIPETYRIIS